VAFIITVDLQKCAGCENCVENCTQEVFTIKRNQAAVKKAFACIGCRVCVFGCKRKAIAVDPLGNHLSDTIKSLLRDCP
jgi:NAD-dependent dihydropyrimidine dehydrogenase PreA subunit